MQKEKIMNFKKLLSIIIIIALSFSLISCKSAGSMISDRKAELNSSDDRGTANKQFDKIMEALKNNDKGGLKKMFSPNALKEAKNIDGGIDYIMEFYKGKIKSKDAAKDDAALEVSDYNDGGEKTSELKVYYTVTTDQDTYIVFFIKQLVDYKNPDNVGLYMLQIIKESDEDNEFDWGTYKRGAGIYRPDTAK